MADYHPETCAYCKTDTWCEIRLNGRPQCRACKVERFFSEILYPPLGYRLIAWQRQTLRELYGTVRLETGRRAYRNAFISVAKQNGKSYLLAGLPLYHIMMEDEMTPEAYGAASCKDQAGIIFKAAAQLVSVNSDLRARIRVLPSTKRLRRRDGHGTYTVLSADGDVQDGIRPSLLLRDELHRWKTKRAETLNDVTSKGQLSRQEPLNIAITTAGAEYESPIWWREYQQAKLVADGTLPPDGLYAAIWQADPKRIESDPNYWKSREARIAANPSHEALGGFLRDEALVAEMNKAIAEPSERSKYLRYNLNVPLKTQEDPVIDMPKWEACGGGVDLREWPEYDPELLIRKWDLLEKPCYAGVDASWTTDLTALVFLFPPFEGTGDVWTWLSFAWLPVERVPEIERVCRVPIGQWVRRNFVHTTDGNAIDLREIQKRIQWAREMFDLREVAYDRLNFRVQGLELVDQGITAIEVMQTFVHLSAATKKVLSLYGDRKIRHGNHPVLNWMAACLQLQHDRKDNVQPTKPPRDQSSKRIDLMQAGVTAMNRALVAKPAFRRSIFADGPVVLQ